MDTLHGVVIEPDSAGIRVVVRHTSGSGNTGETAGFRVVRSRSVPVQADIIVFLASLIAEDEIDGRG